MAFLTSCLVTAFGGGGKGLGERARTLIRKRLFQFPWCKGSGPAVSTAGPIRDQADAAWIFSARLKRPGAPAVVPPAPGYRSHASAAPPAAVASNTRSTTSGCLRRSCFGCGAFPQTLPSIRGLQPACCRQGRAFPEVGGVGPAGGDPCKFAFAKASADFDAILGGIDNGQEYVF